MGDVIEAVYRGRCEPCGANIKMALELTEAAALNPCPESVDDVCQLCGNPVHFRLRKPRALCSAGSPKP